MMDFMFMVFAGLTVLGALVMAFHHNIVHSAFALVMALVGVAGLYWSLGADFLGGLQLLLYVGGVTVLLLFAVMLTTRDTARLSIVRYGLMAPVVGIAGFFLLRAYEGVQIALDGRGIVPGEPEPTTARIGQLFLTPDGFLVPFQTVAVLLLLVLIGAVTVARRGSETTP